MTAFWLSLRTEFLKSRRTLALFSTVFIPIVMALLSFLVIYLNADDFARMGANMWNILVQNIFGIFGALLLPMYAMAVAYSVNHIEYTADAWKNLFALPLPRGAVYASKIAFAMILMSICLALLCVLTFATGQLLAFLKPELGFQDYDSSRLILVFYLKFYVSSFGIFAIQFVLSNLWPDFIRPVGVGLVATIAGLMLAGWKRGWLIPYSLPQRINAQFSKEVMEVVTKEFISSCCWAAVFVAIGYVLIVRRNT